MKFENDKNLFKICVYVVLTAIAIYIAYGVLGNIGNILVWVGSVLVIIAELLKPLIIAFVIAYLLYPLVHAIEKFLDKKNIFKNIKVRRSIGIIVTYIGLITAIVVLIIGIYFMIGGKISENLTISKIIDGIMAYIENLNFNVADIEKFIKEYNLPIPTNINELLQEVVVAIQGFVVNIFNNVTENIVSISSNVVSAFIAFIISIYLLIDTEYFIDIWKKFYFLIFRKSKLGNGLSKAAKIVHVTFYNYIKGQLLDAIIVGILSSIALAIIGVDYAIVIGMIAGICNMIPYIGPVIGTVLASVVALLSGDFILIIWVIVAMIIVQQIDNNLLAPKIVGDSVGLHPIFTMIAILIGGNIGGLFGMLMAVPLTAAAKIIIKEWYENNIDYPKPLKLKLEYENEENEENEEMDDNPEDVK